MTVTVLDSTNLNAIISEATGEPIEEEGKQESGEKNESTPEPKAVKKSDGKDTDEGGKKESENDADKKDKRQPDADSEKEKTDEKTDPDDVEGDDGLTPRQKREFTQGMLKTIGKKHRQMKEAEEFAAAQYNERKLAEKRAAELQSRLEASQVKPEDQQAKEAAKPKSGDYGTPEEYIEALTDWKVDEKIRVREAERAQQELVSNAKKRIDRAIELIPDYRDTIAPVDIELPPVVAGYMQKSPMLAELGYYLAKNQDKLLSIQKLSPDEQLVTIGKIEATLKPFSESPKDSSDGEKPSSTEAKSASETITGKSPSKARNTAPVIQPLNVAGTIDKAPEDMNIRETIVDWQKHNNANLHLRKRH